MMQQQYVCFQPKVRMTIILKISLINFKQLISTLGYQDAAASYPECNTLWRSSCSPWYSKDTVKTTTSVCVSEYLRFKEVSDCRPMMLSGMVLMQLWYRFSVSKATRWQTSVGTSASLFFERSAERRGRNSINDTTNTDMSAWVTCTVHFELKLIITLWIFHLFPEWNKSLT